MNYRKHASKFSNVHPVIGDEKHVQLYMKNQASRSNRTWKTALTAFARYLKTQVTVAYLAGVVESTACTNSFAVAE